MKNIQITLLALISGILIGLLTVSEYQEEWSEGKLLYASPDTTQIRGFQAVVDAQHYYIVQNHFRLFPSGSAVGDSTDFSEIFKIKVNSDHDVHEKQLTDGVYPAEYPAIYKGTNEEFTILWTERTFDPEFETWNDGRPPVDIFSNSLVTFNTNNPERIFDNTLSPNGGGSILSEIRMTEDQGGAIHGTFSVLDVFKVGSVSGDSVLISRPKTAYFRKNESSTFTETVFLEIGNNPDITSLNNRIFVAAFNSASSTNDVFLSHSDDNGKTWSKEELVYLTNDPGVDLRIETGRNGTLHIVWGSSSTGSIFLPDQYFHIYSEDGGKNWSNAQTIFSVDESEQVGLNIIDHFEIYADKFGKLHWVASGLIRSNSRNEKKLYYSEWNPLTKQWNQSTEIQMAEFPARPKFAYDSSTNELNLIWMDSYNGKNFSALYYSKKPIQEPDSLPDLPVVAESGPLQLHDNYPNPFNSSTNISFTLLEPGEVELRVYDMSGKRVIQRELGTRVTGRHDHALQMDNLPSGNYLYNLVVDGTHNQQGQMVLVK